MDFEPQSVPQGVPERVWQPRSFEAGAATASPSPAVHSGPIPEWRPPRPSYRVVHRELTVIGLRPTTGPRQVRVRPSTQPESTKSRSPFYHPIHARACGSASGGRRRRSSETMPLAAPPRSVAPAETRSLVCLPGSDGPDGPDASSATHCRRMAPLAGVLRGPQLDMSSVATTGEAQLRNFSEPDRYPVRS
jgi:hypothetical protein